jgi:hypothetical protein
MTLGNSPQPLTRRQLRELARENEPVAVDNEAPAAESADRDSTSGTATGSHSRHTSAGKGTAPDRAPDQPKTDEKTPAKRAGEPHAGKPAAAKPDAAKPDAAKPDAAKPDAVKPDAVKPAAVKRDAVKPAPAKPAAAQPIPAPLVTPDAAPTPVVIDSVVVDPGRALTRRELRALQAAASASAAPETGAPETSTSATGTPSADAPAPARTAPPAATPGPPAPAAAVPAASEPTGLTPPLGHWSIDRDDDSHIETIGRRDDQTFDDLVGRGIGAGGIPTTTNALILPAIPRQGNAGPITSTGEIMITGSIDLPRSLGATGQHPNLFDSSEMDRMLDQLDEGGHHNDVAPVSASRAVSTHTSTRGVMTPPRKRGASLPTVLAITAAVLAIGVLSLFVVGYAFNIY